MRVFFFSLFLLCLHPLFSEEGINIEVRAGGYYSEDHLYKRIYREWSPDFAIEISKTFCTHWMLWVNGDLITKKGHSLDLGNDTRIWIRDLSFGFKYLFTPGNFASPYLGFGINGAYVHVRNSSSFISSPVSKAGVGAVLKTGLYTYLTPCLYLDLFVDFVYQPVRMVSWRQLGGVKPGVGLGYSF
jgi:hypothetical protein